MENVEEIWKAIDGYEGFYEVSSLGNIKSLDRISESIWMGKPHKCPFKGIALIPSIEGRGYHKVTLCVHGKTSQHKVHRLVAVAFIPNPENKPMVNHINGIKHDNRLVNLEWCTCSENHKHAIKTGLRVASKGAKSILSFPVSQFTMDGVLVREWSAIMEVKRETGWCSGNISRGVSGKRKMAYGFIWRITEVENDTNTQV